MSAKPKFKSRYRRLRLVLAAAVLAAALGYVYWSLFLTRTIRSDDAYVAGNIIAVQALVPGVVVDVHVDNSMLVRVDQPLIEQEQNLVREHLEKNAAALAEAVRQVRGQMAQAEQADHEIALLQVRRRKLADDLERYIRAEAGGAVAEQKVADTRADLAILDQQLLVARNNAQKAHAPVAATTPRDNPLVRQKRADFIESFIQLQRAHVLAPVAGFVANRRAQAGQPVSAGQLLLNIVPLRDLWVTANIKETDMTRIRPGQPVAVQSHGYGAGTRYRGRVLGIEPAGGSTFSLFPPDNSTGNYIHIVERVPVRIGLDPDELAAHPLRPGMSVSVAIDTTQQTDTSALHSEVAAAGASYSTSIYRREMAEANSAADAIIARALQALETAAR